MNSPSLQLLPKLLKFFSFSGKLYDELFLRGLCLSKTLNALRLKFSCVISCIGQRIENFRAVMQNFCWLNEKSYFRGSETSAVFFRPEMICHAGVANIFGSSNKDSPRILQTK